MTEPDSTGRTKQALGDLKRQIATRVEAESSIEATYEAAIAQAERDAIDALHELQERYGREASRLQSEYDQRRRQATSDFESNFAATESEYETRLQDIEREFESQLAAAEQVRQEAMLEATAVFDTAEKRLNQELATLKKKSSAFKIQLEEVAEDIETTVAAGIESLESRRLWRTFPDAELVTSDTDQPVARLKELQEESEEQFATLQGQIVAELFGGMRPLWLLLACWVLLAMPTVLIFGFAWSDFRWLIVSGLAAVIVTALALGGLYTIASRQTAAAHAALQRIGLEARSLFDRAKSSLEAELRQRQETCQQRYAETMARKNQDTESAEKNFQSIKETAGEEKEKQLAETNEKFPALLAELTKHRDAAIRELDEKYPPQLTALKEDFERKKKHIEAARDQRKSEIESEQQRQWQAMVHGWREGLGRFRDEIAAMNSQCSERFPPWPELSSDAWHLTNEVPPAIPIGRFYLDLREVEGGIPRDPRLAPVTTTFSLPLFLPFPENLSLLIKATGSGRTQAVEFLQTTMLRLLVALPPGRVRFTVIDPVGLGENFSAFMHLADFDELLISSRIWTETNHIDRRLTDLTEHMENVFQKYLRNEFRSIQEYNRQAGEVAEPYHFLVVANFPTNFSENAARRLVSIVTSGPRCGVYTLISYDQKQQLPFNFNMDDIEQNVASLRASSGKLLWKHPDLGEIQLRLDERPTPEQLRTIVRKVGRESKGARRVEVSFERIAPLADARWTASSKKGIDVALGRAGATKLQHLSLGSGTAQHVLIAGKTGSGKSTLLHAIVTNLALHYSPDEVEVYLVDFKKGVEFKTYATHALPHARVIAIESDREFGVSVLERLDEIMHERGDEFRREGVQDVAGFRERRPERRMPRLLLLIDEFQEFFVEDDRVAQTSALLLDRLIRQGRAFGIHVVLGSQTLSGAYTLARSTLGQVAVRIALECSEADAHVILSEENTAARRLTRPGEAIYNDASGLIEGNNPFQVAWLADEKRETYLDQINSLAEKSDRHWPRPIIFEGNVPADLADNHLLAELLQATEPPTTTAVPRAWLGSAVSIKDPVSVAFERQSGSNLIVAGRDAEAAQGVLSAALVGLSAHYLPRATADESGAAFYLLDGSPEASDESDHWQELVKSLPHTIEIASPRSADKAIAAITEELTRRQQADDDAADPIYLIVFNLARFRSLRKAEDDFGFGGMDDEKKVSPDKQFADLIREGSNFGIHLLIWCDTFANLERWLPRRSLQEFEMRVAFQMGSSDSSQLIDTPLAAKLGPHRALLYQEHVGSSEKFRPYSPPTREWLEANRDQLWRGVDFFLS